MTKESKLRSAEPCLGTWLSSGSPMIAELASQCGFGWLLLDMEHGCLTEADLIANLRAAHGSDTMLIVRVPTHDAGLIGRALDWGADGIMVPHVNTAEEAAAIVSAMRYPPDGARGYSRSVRAYGYGLHKPETRPAPILFVQIETAEAVRNVRGIAAVPGVDVLFVGPADLGLSLSVEADAPAFEDALDHVVCAVHEKGLRAGILVRNAADTADLLQRGFTKLAIDSDISILRSRFLAIGAKG